MASQAAKPHKTSTPKTVAAEPGFRSVVGRTPRLKIAGDVVNAGPGAAKPPVTVTADKFKATCLKLLDRSAQGETITITKRGKVVGRLVPPEPEIPKAFRPLFGRMKGQIKILGDIVGPDFEAWQMRDH